MGMVTRREGTRSLCRVFRSAEMAHTENLSLDRPHSGRPPSTTIYVYARTGLIHTSANQLERVYLPAGRQLDLQEQGTHPSPTVFELQSVL